MIVSTLLAVGYFRAVWWWGWPAPPNWIGWLTHADGEGAYDALMFSLWADCVVLGMAVFTLGRWLAVRLR